MIDNYATLFDGLTPTDGSLYKRSKNVAAAALSASAPRKTSNATPKAALTSPNAGTPPRSGASSPSPASGGPALPTKPVSVKKSGKVPFGQPLPGMPPAPTSPKAPAKMARRNSALKASQGESSPEEAVGVMADSTPPSNSNVAAAAGAAAAQRPPCARCGEQIRGAGLKALGVAWHRDCFVCTHCEQPFTGKILQKEGKPYCEADFKSLFGGAQAKVCRACGEKISGPFMKALNAHWHAQHFVCAQCGGSVADGYYEREERPWCADCFQSVDGAEGAQE